MMKKFLIEGCIGNDVWDNYTGRFIESESYEDAVDQYKKELVDSGDFSEIEVNDMEYRASAETKYILRDKRTLDQVGIYSDYETAINNINDSLCLEECVINLGGEPISESVWHE